MNDIDWDFPHCLKPLDLFSLVIDTHMITGTVKVFQSQLSNTGYDIDRY